jgi:tight adherence protein B
MGAHWENALVSPELVQLAAMALAGLATGCGVYVLVMPFLSGERKVGKRIANVAQRQTWAQRRAGLPQSLQMRKQQVQDTIKNIEAKQKATKRAPLRMRLIRAGLTIKPRIYYLWSLLAGLVGGFIVLVTGSSLIVSLLVAFVCGFGLPRWILSRLIKGRQAKFLREFANAIDIIVRGIKSGLSLSDSLQIIANESSEPVRSEFNDIVEQLRIGVPLSSAFERMYERMPLQEVSFFAIVIAIQAQTGGNLAEALSNLSQVLRDRYRLQAKVKAFSSEAKTSAMIIGALPLIVMLLMFLTSPDYISLLWKEGLGIVMLIGSGIWMTLGIIVMRRMITFDY